MIKSRHIKELAFFFTTLFLVSLISYLVVNPGFAIWKKDQHQLDVIPPMGWTVVDEESSKNFYNMDMVLKVSLKSGKLYLW